MRKKILEKLLMMIAVSTVFLIIAGAIFQLFEAISTNVFQKIIEALK